VTAQNIEAPLVSVIVPVYDGADFLSHALDSIFAQSYDNFEVIVVDDGSTDTTSYVAQQYEDRIEYVYQSNQGPAAARNAGILRARGSILAFLDSDDLWMPEKLHLQVTFLSSHPQSQCVAAKFEYFIAPDAKDVEDLRPEWLAGGHTSRFLSGLIVQKGIFKRVGLFDTKLRFGEDVEWFFRLEEAGIKCTAIEQVLVQKRIHKNNVTHQTAAMTSDTLAALRRGIRQKTKGTQ
jgi:glycosyltransferase involved in cell wall biosynthesis